MPHSDRFIVYVDESGDHGLNEVDPTYPIFVLAFCVFPMGHYIESVVFELLKFKFKYFGHDMVVMHEREIRKALPPFQFLKDSTLRGPFMEGLNAIMEKADFKLLACAIRKDDFKARDDHDGAANLYHIAMNSCLTRLWKFLERKGESNTVHVVFEERGKNEDRDLELEFRRFVNDTKAPLDIKFASKKVNSCGLQLADLVARPIGRHLIDGAGNTNRAFEIIKSKMNIGPDGVESDDFFYVEVFPS